MLFVKRLGSVSVLPVVDIVEFILTGQAKGYGLFKSLPYLNIFSFQNFITSMQTLDVNFYITQIIPS